MSKRTSKGRSGHNKSRRRNTNTRLYWLLGLLMVAMAAYVLLPVLSKTKRNSKSTPASTSEPARTAPSPKENTTFEKEGTLKFLKAGSDVVIKELDIEVSDSESERNQGLMYRQSMKDGEGMLFIFEKSMSQAFWMKNTYISLDIMFVNEDLVIISIGKNTKPLSQQSVRSAGPAMYVVEVPGGFTDAYGLTPGDRISFEID